MILLQCRNDLGFADDNVRLAAHHAIDKQALSKAFYGGAAVPLSVVATPGTAGYLADFKFDYDPEAGGAAAGEVRLQHRASRRRSNSRPPTAHFPSDFDIARAMQQMWKKVGIDAELETIEYAKYFELNRGAKLPEATLYSWDNATGDPEIFAGYLLNPKMPFSAWKGAEVGDKVVELFNVADYEKRIDGLSRARTLRGREGRHHSAAAKRADGRAQEDADLRQIRERLDSRRQDGLGLIRSAVACAGRHVPAAGQRE